MGQNRQGMTSYLPDPDTYKPLSSQPVYMNTEPKTTNMGIPMAESTPVPLIGPTLYRLTPTSRVCDILEPLANEQARESYLERQMRHMKSVQLPLSLPTSDDRSLEEDSLSRKI